MRAFVAYPYLSLSRQLVCASAVVAPSAAPAIAAARQTAPDAALADLDRRLQAAAGVGAAQLLAKHLAADFVSHRTTQVVEAPQPCHP